MKGYDHKKIEKKWQAEWEKNEVNQAQNSSQKPKYYSLIEFPYPSGDGLHVGHPRPYIGMDVISRKKRMEGYNVLYPIGWDAFGLPTENYAIKTGKDPRVVTEENSDNFRRQIKSIGISFDWSREVNTTDPKYYKWTQWIFLQFLKKGLAYKARIPINWCLSCKIGLANEEVVGGVCERCGGPVEKREKEQWMLAITKYAERLDKDLDTVDYLPHIKLAQKNWIGKSEGAELKFKIHPTPTLPEGKGEFRKNNYIVLHGWESDSKDNKYAAIKNEIENTGALCYLPDLPNTATPSEDEQVNFVLNNAKFDKNTILFGKSLGAVVAMKVLERLEQPIAGVILAAGFVGMEGLYKKDYPFRNTFSWKFDFKKIKKNAGFVKILSDLEDRAVLPEQGRVLHQNLGGELVETIAVKPHFGANYEPAILNSILGNFSSSLGRPGGVFGYHTTDPKIWRALQNRVLEMRENPTEAEELLWQSLRKNLTGYHFRRQHIISRFIVDFVCLEKSLVVEVDGDVHDYKKTEDEERTKFLKQIGFRVIRFSNKEVLNDINKIVEKINTELKVLPFGEDLGGVSEFVTVFTTRPDTVYGATYVVLAPEHAILQNLKSKITNWGEVQLYVAASKAKNDQDRTKEEKNKTGVELKGIKAINPATSEEIPIWVADYVLLGYGTGAIMAVPAHDERDFEFAKKYNLPIKYVIAEQEFEQESKPKEGMPFIYRKAVECYIRNPKTDEFLMMKWKVTSWKTAVTGGVEEGEDIVEAAKREIYEETGYKNLKFIQQLGAPMRVEFFHPDKNENRRADFYGVYFELENEEREEISKKEQEKHDVVWVPRNELLNFITTSPVPFKKIGVENLSFGGDGILINSGRFDGLDSKVAKKKIIQFVGGEEKTTFKLRDWVFSRQRYWGEPIPVIHCPKCGIVPVPEKDLPVELPKVKDYLPTDNGDSPLVNISKWVNVKCPKCNGKAKRETDTMPNWAGSSWYYLRYTDPKNTKAFADKKNLKYWTPVNWYNGGNEHTTLHLLYSRFWHKFLYDLKLVPTSEPYMKRTSHGLILAEGGEKMSKSKGNVINPDDIVARFGADTLRLYEMFMGPFDQAIAWSEEAIIGPRRFLEKVWKIASRIQKNSAASPSLRGLRHGPNFPVSAPLTRILYKTIKKVSEDIENMRFNTAISTLMIFLNEVEKNNFQLSTFNFQTFIKLLAPFAPHMTEELWSALGEKGSITLSPWPKYDKSLILDEEVKIAVQVNGKVRAEITISANATEEEVKNKALSDPNVMKYLTGGNPQKTIYIKGRLINIVP